MKSSIATPDNPNARKKMRYPCSKCNMKALCDNGPLFETCEPWKRWFREKWNEIRAMFGR